MLCTVLIQMKTARLKPANCAQIHNYLSKLTDKKIGSGIFGYL